VEGEAATYLDAVTRYFVHRAKLCGKLANLFIYLFILFTVCLFDLDLHCTQFFDKCTQHLFFRLYFQKATLVI